MSEDETLDALKTENTKLRLLIEFMDQCSEGYRFSPHERVQYHDLREACGL